MIVDVVALKEVVTSIKRNHKACSGTAACPCNQVSLLLQSVQNVGQTADALSSMGNPDVQPSLLIDLSTVLLEGGHSPLAALGSAEAYYRYVACPLQNSHGSSSSSRDISGSDTDLTRQLGKQLLQSDLMQSFPGRLHDTQLTKKWQKVLTKLQKVLQALPPNQKHFSAANAAKLEEWLSRNANGLLVEARDTSHVFLLWVASLCRLLPGSIFEERAAHALILPAVNTATELLHTVSEMSKLQAAGLSFTGSVDTAASAAAALEALSLLLVALSAWYQEMVRGLEASAESDGPGTGTTRKVPVWQLAAAELMGNHASPRLLYICIATLCFNGSQLVQHLAAGPTATTAPAAGTPTGGTSSSARASSGSSSSGDAGNSSSRGSSTREGQRTPWELAEGSLLLGADTLRQSLPAAWLRGMLARLFHYFTTSTWPDIGITRAMSEAITSRLDQHGFLLPTNLSSSSMGDRSSSDPSSGGSGSSSMGVAPSRCLAAACAGAVLQHPAMMTEVRMLGQLSTKTGSIPPDIKKVRTMTPATLCTQLLEAPQWMLCVFSAQLQLEGASALQHITPQARYLWEYLAEWDVAQLFFESREKLEQRLRMLQAELMVLGQATKLLQQLVLLQISPCDLQAELAAGSLGDCLEAGSGATVGAQPYITQQAAAAVGSPTPASDGCTAAVAAAGPAGGAMDLTSAHAELTQDVVMMIRHILEMLGYQLKPFTADIKPVLHHRLSAQAVCAVQACEAAVRMLAAQAQHAAGQAAGAAAGRQGSSAANSSMGSTQSEPASSSSSSRPPAAHPAGKPDLPSMPPKLAVEVAQAVMGLMTRLHGVGFRVLNTAEGLQLVLATCSLMLSAAKMHQASCHMTEVLGPFMGRVSDLVQFEAAVRPSLRLLAAAGVIPGSGNLSGMQGFKGHTVSSSDESSYESVEQALLQVPYTLLLTATGHQFYSLGQQLQSELEHGRARAAAAHMLQSIQLVKTQGTCKDVPPMPFASALLSLLELTEQLLMKLSKAEPSTDSNTELKASSDKATSSSSSTGGGSSSGSKSSNSKGPSNDTGKTAQDGPSASARLVSAVVLKEFATCSKGISASVKLLIAEQTRLQDISQSTTTAGVIQQLAQELLKLGSLLCTALPGAFYCNNPGCTNLATVSESFALVRGKACICGGCLEASRPVSAAARYCSRQCQAQHWPDHKRVCGHLRLLQGCDSISATV